MKKLLLMPALIFMISGLSAQVNRVPEDYSSIQEAIDASSDGDTVLVDEGTWYENINYNGKAITVASHFLMDGDSSHISKTIIDGSKPEIDTIATVVTMLEAIDTTSVLCGFTIQGGKGTNVPAEGGVIEGSGCYGGGVWMAGGKIVSNIIRENHLAYYYVAAGAGISGGSLTKLGSDPGINIVIRGNRVYNNTIHTQDHYAAGGGINVSIMKGITIVEENEIYKNTTLKDSPYKACGAGLLVTKVKSSTGKGFIRRNYIHHNQALSDLSFGGGIFYLLTHDQKATEFYPTYFENNIIESNYSTSYGGGIACWYLWAHKEAPPLDPVFVNNTIVDNEAALGSGLSVIDSEVAMVNNIVNNIIPEGGSEIFEDVFFFHRPTGPYWPHDYNVAKINAAFNNIHGGYPGIGNIDKDPKFESDTLLLSEESPCIGRGADSVLINDYVFYATGTDYSGKDRASASSDREIDLGAIESPYNRKVTTFVSENVINVPDDQLTIQAAIDASKNGDTILVEEGIYYENINYGEKDITVGSKFIIHGDESHIAQTIIDGSKPDYDTAASVVTMLHATDTTTVLSGFTITGGSGSGPMPAFVSGEAHHGERIIKTGGGIFMAGGKIINNIVLENHVSAEGFAYGSGISAGALRYFTKEKPINYVIRHNYVFHNSVHSNTNIAYGGGIIAEHINGYALIENNRIFKNQVSSDNPYSTMAGGLGFTRYTSGEGNTIVRNNYVYNNELHSQYSFGGGSMFALVVDDLSGYPDNFKPAEIYNNIISNNNSKSHGGGLGFWYLWDAFFPCPMGWILYNNTIVDNNSDYGAGICLIDAKIAMFNNVLWNKDPRYGTEIFTDLFSNSNWPDSENTSIVLSVFNNIKGGYTGIGDINSDPFIDSLTFQPGENSPSIGRGTDSIQFSNEWFFAPSVDIKGVNRILASEDHEIDQGAVESPYNRPRLTYDTETVINVPEEQPTIQSAIDAAQTGDTVLIEEGWYTENINFRGKAITLGSKYLADRDKAHISQTIIDGSEPLHPDSGSVVTFNSGEDTTSVLEGVTLIGGSGTLWNGAGDYKVNGFLSGAGVLISGSGGKLTHNIITRNQLNFLTGGISHYPDSLAWGSGICAWVPQNKNLIISDNRIYDNHISSDNMGWGGGILVMGTGKYMDVYRNNVFKNTVHSNLGLAAGGGFAYFRGSENEEEGSLQIRDNFIMDNHTISLVDEKNFSLGGGMILDEFGMPVNLKIFNNIICNNTSSERGGGIVIENSEVELMNNTIIDNLGQKDGNSLFIRDFKVNSRVTLFNNILWSKHKARDEIVIAPGNSLYTFHNDIRGGHDPRWDINTQPEFYNNTYKLRYGNLCIGRGADSVEVNGNWHKAPLKDMHGNPRKYSGRIDLGAIETPFSMNEHFAFTDTSIRGSGDCDYVFDIEFEGGMPPYSFYLDEDEFDNIPFEGVCKGAHTVKIEDSEGKVLTWITSVGVGLEENSTGLGNFKLWPNPASRSVNLKFNLAISAPVRIIIFNTMGKQEKMFEYDAMLPGFHDVEMDISGIKPGLYFLKIESEKTEIVKLIIQ